MKEFMFIIRNVGDAKANFSPEKNMEFLMACELYIDKLMQNGNIKSAQPLVREGTIISGTPGAFKEAPYNESKEIIVGYYHILANDLSEAISIAKENPEFAYHSDAKIEVRPVKMKEESTSYDYPGRG